RIAGLPRSLGEQPRPCRMASAGNRPGWCGHGPVCTGISPAWVPPGLAIATDPAHLRPTRRAPGADPIPGGPLVRHRGFNPDSKLDGLPPRLRPLPDDRLDQYRHLWWGDLGATAAPNTKATTPHACDPFGRLRCALCGTRHLPKTGPAECVVECQCRPPVYPSDLRLRSRTEIQTTEIPINSFDHLARGRPKRPMAKQDRGRGWDRRVNRVIRENRGNRARRG